jgi:glycosyltransferase involved in cell wall biosynthesis
VLPPLSSRQSNSPFNNPAAPQSYVHSPSRTEGAIASDTGANLMPTRSDASVVILLCTFNASHFLEDQLKSLEGQTHRNWRVVISDDGSTDGTLERLYNWKGRLGQDRLLILSGPQRGFAINFLSLACRDIGGADYYAFADQDDVWEAEKLERALAHIEAVPLGQPALYCSRTRLIDAAGHPRGFSPKFSRPPSFRNALIQSVGGGNTMVFNKAARQLLIQFGGAVDVVSHDWWLYIIVSGSGGHVDYDTWCSVRYRQHNNNAVGSNSSWRARAVRIKRLMRGQFREWSDRHVSALSAARERLTADSQFVLDEFSKGRQQQAFLLRIFRCWSSGIYRQTTLGNVGLIIAILLRKI